MNTKICSHCKIEKPITEFHKSSTRKDGLASKCKACRSEYHKIYRQSEKVKEAERKACKKHRETEQYKKKSSEYRKSQQRKDVLKRWNNSDKGKQCKERYDNSDKGKKASYIKNHKYPNKRNARAKIAYRVEKGMLPKATELICAECNNQATAYHHYKGYEPEHHLDVIPLCRTCHIAADAKL